eukprot:TRINITY_DN22003_c0_g1_i2.p1 TRINITY_DN22003_c0_g1~~TRINITY_DN22003_c0_g1_i2.p1  ORF type:complete len:330 (-),score=41.49 TRINITY_DN22003_c0_g1_i2:4-993(-)
MVIYSLSKPPTLQMSSRHEFKRFLERALVTFSIVTAFYYYFIVWSFLLPYEWSGSEDPDSSGLLQNIEFICNDSSLCKNLLLENNYIRLHTGFVILLGLIFSTVSVFRHRRPIDSLRSLLGGAIAYCFFKPLLDIFGTIYAGVNLHHDPFLEQWSADQTNPDNRSFRSRLRLLSFGISIVAIISNVVLFVFAGTQEVTQRSIILAFLLLLWKTVQYTVLIAGLIVSGTGKARDHRPTTRISRAVSLHTTTSVRQLAVGPHVSSDGSFDVIEASVAGKSEVISDWNLSSSPPKVPTTGNLFPPNENSLRAPKHSTGLQLPPSFVLSDWKP